MEWRAERKARDIKNTYTPEQKQTRHENYKKWAGKNPECVKEHRDKHRSKKVYTLEEKQRQAERGRKWRNDNLERARGAALKLYYKYKTDPSYRINHALGSALNKALKGNKAGRSWEKLVGYTVEDLMAHLSKNFKDGMTFENYGEWHIDHIIPKSVFNYTKVAHRDFKRCWAMNNLQPLWANENRKKNAKLKEHFQPMLLLEEF